MIKDPLIRRLISSSCFAGAFIWVAVRYFDVETEVVWTFFGLSFIFVAGLIVIGLVLAPMVRLFRRKPSLLSKIDESLDELEEPISESIAETALETAEEPIQKA